MPFIANTSVQLREMLEAIGVKNFDELIQNIPQEVRLQKPLDLPPAMSQFEITRHLARLAEQNANLDEYLSFLGGGAYDHFIPALVNHIIMRPEFYTSYTPYQAEVSQGNLQVIYEYQSMICELTGMYAANASMYDGGSALAEAALLALAATNRRKIIIPDSVHPNYRRILATYVEGLDVEIATVQTLRRGAAPEQAIQDILDETCAAVIVQHPNFFGQLEAVQEIGAYAKAKGALFIVSVDPLSLALLQPPGEYGADVVVGEAQCFGNSLSYGGPYVGIFAATQKLLRKMPGRIAGATVDRQGRRGFVLTLQTREQHIRRDKATSNICTNQALNATAAAVYLALMGKEGLREVAMHCTQKAHYLAAEIQKLPGFELAFAGPFFKEFVLKTPIPSRQVVEQLLPQRIFAGVALAPFYEAQDMLLVAVTEKRTKTEMDRFVNALRNLK